MATEQDLPLPPKDEFEDGSDAELLGIQKDLSANNQQEYNEPAVKPIKGRTVSWKYVWVKSPSIFPGLPPVFTKKWVRTITGPQETASLGQNSEASERSELDDNRSEQAAASDHPKKNGTG